MLNLGEVKLRKTVTRDASKAAAEPTLCNNSEDYYKLMQEAFMEQYWDAIKSYSFGSCFSPLSRDTAQALIQAFKKTKTQANWLESEDFGKEKEISSHLITLENTIDKLKKEAKWNYIFVRLSSRSPKDAIFASSQFHKIFEHERVSLEKEQKDVKESPLYNIRLQALYRAMTWSMRLKTGREALQLLVNSDRVKGDLEDYVAGKMKEPFNVVVREFRTFAPEMEFRGFVYQRRLTALTQYNEFCYFHFLKDRADDICNKIKEEFAVILPKLPLSNCVVDFVLCPKAEDDNDDRSRLFDIKQLQVFVVELNPLAEFAGSGLFSWSTDKSILLAREGEVVFRYRKEAPPLAWSLTNMTPEWRSLIVDKDDKEEESVAGRKAEEKDKAVVEAAAPAAKEAIAPSPQAVALNSADGQASVTPPAPPPPP